jgi:cytosine/adenosine deaminase-related metal-dependent hydrolase
MHVYRARWVVPVTAPPVRDGAITVEDGRIAYVGPQRGAPSGEVRDLGAALLLPGLVNTHTHLELTAMRGFLEDLPFAEWIVRLQRAKTTVLTPDSMLDAAKLGIAEGLLAGITTYADTCDSGVALEAMRAMGVRGIMYQEVFGPDPASCDQAVAALRQKLAVHTTALSPLVRLGVSPHAPYTVSDELFEATAALSAELTLPMAVHIAESAEEDTYVCDASGPFAEGHRARGFRVVPRADTPVALLARLGVLARRPLLIHCVRTRESDIRAIAAARCAIAHCPASNAKLGHGIAPLDEWLAQGITVGLGSDSMASNNRMHLLEEARLAILAHRGRTPVRPALSAARGLELATIGGARCLDLQDEVGSLEAGKAADFAAFSLDEFAATPHTDPIASAVFALGGAHATTVVVAGNLRVRDGRLIDADHRIAARVHATGEALRASAVSPTRTTG